jgi:RNA polymerase sigma-70 factor, ECF subfamily
MNETQSDVLSDDVLIARVQSGNLSAFEPLIDRHLVHLRTFLALKAPVASLVDEVAHESFVFAFRNLQSYRPGTSFRAWLRSIASNLLRAEIQRYSREQANHERLAAYVDCQSQSPDPEPTSPVAEHLQECIEELPDSMRELLVLKYRDGRSTEEISGKLSRSLAWVRTVLFRLRQQLKSCIDQKLGKERPC